jgi:hypothetical protein
MGGGSGIVSLGKAGAAAIAGAAMDTAIDSCRRFAIDHLTGEVASLEFSVGVGLLGWGARRSRGSQAVFIVKWRW